MPTPTPVPGPSISISRLLPNAAGNEAQNEEVWLRNSGPDEIDLSGWRLRDLSNSEWTLGRATPLPPGEEKKVLRAGEPMKLNNTGDTIMLVEPSGQTVDSISYDVIGEGIEVIAQN